MEKNIVTDQKKVTVDFVRDIFSISGDFIHKQGESLEFLPVLVQSCMNPEEFHLYPIKVEHSIENGKDKITVSSHVNMEKYNAEDVTLHFEEYKAMIKKKTCATCNNCGRC